MSAAFNPRKVGVLGAVLLYLTIGGCALTGKADPEIKNFVLVSPDALGREVSAYQQLLVTQGARSRQLTLAVDIRQSKLQLVVMSSLGQRLATWRYDAYRYALQVEPGAPADLPYRHLLVAMQWVFWPQDALAGVNGSSWRFSDNGVYYRDTLVAKLGRPGLRVASWDGEYRVEFQASGLKLDLLSTPLD